MHTTDKRRVLGVAAALAFAAPLTAQTPAAPAIPATPAALRSVAMAPVPFAVGEELVYGASFARISAGTARMKVLGIEMVRGRPAYHVSFTLDGGIPFFRVHDRYDSWIDVETLSSLRYQQQISEGRYHRNTTYEIFPERAEYQKNGGAAVPSVRHPLDDGSFIYAIRAAGVKVGETRRDDRYFQPDRNPVVLQGLRREAIEVDAGKYAATVVRPTIRTSGIFSENGDALVWFSDDAHRYPVRVQTHFSKFSVVLSLKEVKPGITPQELALDGDASR